jgi:hypothetical protein
MGDSSLHHPVHVPGGRGEPVAELALFATYVTMPFRGEMVGLLSQTGRIAILSELCFSGCMFFRDQKLTVKPILTQCPFPWE